MFLYPEADEKGTTGKVITDKMTPEYMQNETYEVRNGELKDVESEPWEYDLLGFVA